MYNRTFAGWRFIVAGNGDCQIEVASGGQWSAHCPEADPHDTAADLLESGVPQRATVFASEHDAAASVFA